jgi:predicted O-linked N-acetylglucosamine transferase (SPINDLY family)
LSLEGHLQEGELLSNRGDHQQAVQSLGKALRIKPDSEKVYSHLSVVMIRLRRYEPALEYINKSLAFDPESLIYICRKASVLRLLGSWREAAAYYRKASQLHPDSAVFHLNQYLMLPGIPISREEIQESRIRFTEGLSIAEANPRLTLDFLNEAAQHTFELAYHNKEDRYLLERYINLMRKLSHPIVETCNTRKLNINRRPPSAKESRLRIGFLSSYFSNHSNAIAFSGLIRHLDREKFEVILIHAANSQKDQARDALDAECDGTVQLPDDYANACEQIYALNLDILYFTDLGMNPNDFVLPLLCTAPIQITGWGIPHTSGIREISYYVSVSGLEPDGAEEFYTEELVRLPGRLPCIFETIGMSFTPLPREYFLLPPDATCIGCLQGLHKLHPDFDIVLEQIAIQNPEAIFVFIEDSIPSRTHLFLNRLESSAPSVRKRCLTLAMMARSEYHSLCHCIDVLLDPIYYGCGITFFEACYVGTPIVTLEGTNLRSRVVANGYREMEIKDMPVVKTLEEYVKLVSILCRDAARRERLQTSILENNHRVFNRIDYVRNFEKFCIEAVRPPSCNHHASQGIT